MTDRDNALYAELRSAKQDARLKVLVWAAVAVVVSLLLACFVSTFQAASNAGRAADAAVAQSKTNEDLLRSMKLADDRRTSILEGIKTADVNEAKRFQALLDTVYGPGVVVLGETAKVRPRGTRASEARSTPAPSPTPGTPSDGRTTGTQPPPSPSAGPEPTPPPALTVPLPAPLPTPAPLFSASPARTRPVTPTGGGAFGLSRPSRSQGPSS